MVEKIICLDTTVLMDFYRMSKKEYSFLYNISKHSSQFTVSIFSQYQIYLRLHKPSHRDYWDDFFQRVITIPFNEEVREIAVPLHQSLKKKGITVKMQDIVIAASALLFDSRLATMDERKYSFIEDLELIAP